MIEVTQAYIASKELLVSQVGGDVVILTPEGGEYYGFKDDPVGALVWDNLQSGATASDLVRAIRARYDVDEETASADLVALLQDLLERGLIKRM